MKKSFTLICACIAMLSSVKAQSDSAKSLGLVAKIDLFWPFFSSSNGTRIFNTPVYINTTNTIDDVALNSVSLEKFIGPHTSIQLTGFYGGISIRQGDNTYAETTNINMYAVAPELKCYLSKSKQHKGMYLGIYTAFQQEHDVILNPISTGFLWVPPIKSIVSYDNSLCGGIIAGVQYYIFKRIDVDFLIGVGEGTQNGYFMSNVETLRQTYNPESVPSGIMNVNVGYKF